MDPQKLRFLAFLYISANSYNPCSEKPDFMPGFKQNLSVDFCFLLVHTVAIGALSCAMRSQELLNHDRIGQIKPEQI